MKKYEQDFLNRLHRNDKYESLSINCKRVYTDVDGMIIDKSLVPVALQTKYPIYLWNNFDYGGGYKISANEAPALPAYTFVRMFVKNDAYDFTQFSGLNDISNTINTGDLVFLYTDDINNPSYFIWIIQGVTNRSLGSIISGMPEKGYDLCEFTIFADNAKAFNEKIGLVRTNSFGVYDFDQISPYSFKQPSYQQTGMIVVPLSGSLSKYFGLVSYFPYENDSISYDFKLKL